MPTNKFPAIDIDNFMAINLGYFIQTNGFDIRFAKGEKMLQN
jgi:hypothetical protein